MRNDHGQDEDWGARGVFALRIATVLTVLAVVALGATGVSHEEPAAPASAPAATRDHGGEAPTH